MEANRLPPREADVAPAPPAAVSGPNSVADPAPLGLAGFALTTFILGLANANVISPKDTFVVLSVAAVYGGLAQLLAGMWAFREGNTFAAAAFSTYGAFWISFVLLIQFFAPENAKAAGPLATNHAIALYLLAFGFFTLYMWIATFRLNIALNLVFLALWLAFAFLGWGMLGNGHTTITHIGGWLAVASAVFAWYTSAAIILEKTIGRVLLPVGPLTR